MRNKETIRKTLRYMRSSIPKLVLTLILSIFIVAMTLYLPILIGDAIDLCIEGGPIDFEAISRLLLARRSDYRGNRAASMDHEHSEQQHHLHHRTGYSP